ncbi:MAG TPA: hypothetical protein VK747_14730 [Blastocatellia bacterium]|nr:hypothetical protein [Blastocatellia bacterium]
MSEEPTLTFSERFDEVISLLRTLAEGLDRVEALQTEYGKRLSELEAKVEARLYDTRPIWEQVLSKLTAFEERQQRTEERQQQMEQRLESIDRRVRWLYDEFKDLKVRLKPVFSDVVKLLNDRDDFEERILKLETERS